MTNTQTYSNQMKKFSNKITVLVCLTTLENYGSRQRISYNSCCVNTA